jgi:hypothetical protein
MMAAPRLLAGLIPVPVIGMVARCTRHVEEEEEERGHELGDAGTVEGPHDES